MKIQAHSGFAFMYRTMSNVLYVITDVLRRKLLDTLIHLMID